jgi:hypothetical protein
MTKAFFKTLCKTEEEQRILDSAFTVLEKITGKTLTNINGEVMPVEIEPFDVFQQFVEGDTIVIMRFTK